MRLLKKISWLLCLAALSLHCQAQVVEELAARGLENIRCAEGEDTLTVSFENNIYRSLYRGVGEAIQACLEARSDKSLRLIVLDNRTPRLCVILPQSLLRAYRAGEATLSEVYRQMGISVDTDEAMLALKGIKETHTSAWKVDIVVYPELFLQNTSFDRLYTYAIDLSPALEMDLWKGARLTAQVAFPIATNLKGEYRKIHPEVVTLSQEFRAPHNIFGKVTLGNFTRNRYGLQLEALYRAGNGRWEAGAVVATTGYSGVVDGEGWYMGRRQRISAFLHASAYEPHTNLQFDLQGGRYIYGDYGVRADCSRHFGEHNIGIYALYTGGMINGGFYFAIPLPGRTWKRHKGFRLKPSDHFAWSYGMVAHGEYTERNLGRHFQTEPGGLNRSRGFYQPDFIRYYLIRDLEKRSRRSRD